MAAAFPVDTDGHEHGPRADHAVLAHLLVTRIKDEVGELGIPWLVVVGDDGRALKIQGTREFAKSNSCDGQEILAFLREWAPPR